ncbi:MAG: Serine/threonine-protein kinase PknD, partial [Planctomycetota bacterium]
MAGSPRHDETVVVGTGGRPPPGPVAGEVQGHRLIELIGGGGMAAVAAAEDPALGRRVAIKLLRGGDEEERRRFLQEARITAQLEHPAIVPVHAAGTAADGSPWYTMTLVRGRTLAEILARERPAPDDRTLLRALVRACQAVAFAHSRGVVHRDLKPANLMLGGFGETLVMDWGLAAVSGTGVDAGSAGPDPDQAVSGTPAYMAPEQVMGGAAAHAAAVDVYALGAILYELLTLEPPAAGGDAEAVLTAAAGGRIPPARRRAPGRRIPRELEAVAARAMAWDPATRYPGAEALAADLERFLDGRPVLALRVPWPQRAAKAVRRNPALAIAAAAALVLGSLAWGAASVRSADLARAAEADAARAAAAAARAVAGAVGGVAAARGAVERTVGRRACAAAA